MNNRLLFFLFYLPTHFFQQHLNVLRAGLAVCFFLAALSNTEDKNYNLKKTILFFVLAAFSHLSILVATPILIARLKIKSINIWKAYSFLAFFCLSVLFLNLEYILSKIDGYGMLSIDHIGFYKTHVISVLVLMTSLIIYKRDNDVIISALLLSIFLLFSAVLDQAYRIIDILLISLLYVFCEKSKNPLSLILNKHIIWNRSLISFLLIGFFFFVFTVNELEYASKEPAIRELKSRGNPDFSYVPYSLFYKSTYRYQE